VEIQTHLKWRVARKSHDNVQVVASEMNTFRKRVKNVVTSKVIEVWTECMNVNK